MIQVQLACRSHPQSTLQVPSLLLHSVQKLHHHPCVPVVLQDMAWCQEYAFENRRFMLHLMVDIMERVAKGSSACMDEAVNIHHNFCECARCKYTVSKTLNPYLAAGSSMAGICNPGKGFPGDAVGSADGVRREMPGRACRGSWMCARQGCMLLRTPRPGRRSRRTCG